QSLGSEAVVFFFQFEAGASRTADPRAAVDVVRSEHGRRRGAPVLSCRGRFLQVDVVAAHHVVHLRPQPLADGELAFRCFHGRPQARASSVRRTRVCTRPTLEPLSDSGAAPTIAPWAAAVAEPSPRGWPTSACSARVERHGTGATAPSTMRASLTVPASTLSAAATDTSGQSNAWRSRISSKADL